jgi:hypothetical protein
MTLRTEPSDRDVRTRLAASRVDLGTRYVTVCVVSLVAGKSGVGSFQQYFYNRYNIVVYTGLRSDSIKNYASRNEARRIAAKRIIFTRISCTLFTCDMYMCRLRHINDPVLSSLKMEGIRFYVIWKIIWEQFDIVFLVCTQKSTLFYVFLCHNARADGTAICILLRSSRDRPDLQ